MGILWPEMQTGLSYKSTVYFFPKQFEEENGIDEVK